MTLRNAMIHEIMEKSFQLEEMEEIRRKHTLVTIKMFTVVPDEGLGMLL